MKATPLSLLPLLLGILFAPAPRAAAPAYTIELLLFEHIGSHTGEQWAERPGEPNWLEMVDLEPRAGDQRVNFNANFTPRSRRELSGIADAMRKAGGYRILKHVAWSQPSYRDLDTRSIRIEAGSEIPAAWLPQAESPIDPPSEQWRPAPETLPERLSHRQLEGSARVHVGKFLHLDLDLLYHRPRAAGEPPPITAGEAEPRVETVRIRNHRRMRSKEIHYLDHPLVGALVIAQPLVTD